MTVHLDILSQVKIASPCTMAWDDMRGDDKHRHCSACDLDVHNVEAMTREEVERLVLDSSGRVCMRIRRRLDNTIILRDCPVGLAAVRQRMRRTLSRAVAFASFLLSAGVLYAKGVEDPRAEAKLVHLQPFKWAHERLSDPPPPLQVEMGDFVLAQPPSPTP